MNASAKKRLLLVDHSDIVRDTISSALLHDPTLEVSATASNCRSGLAEFVAARPDLVLLDIKMPDADGLKLIRELRKIDKRVPIILFNTPTDRAAAATLDALSLGATDCVTKPGSVETEPLRQTILRELIPKLRELCLSQPRHLAAALDTPTPSAQQRVEIVAIGVSTGGPEALGRLLPTLPADLSVPIVIAQHMPHIFTALLAARLAARCKIAVRECNSGETLAPGSAFIAPGDWHMVIDEQRKACLRTHRGPKENFCRPSVDVLFRSVAQAYGARALGIVLTGMGQDGLKGCHALRQRGARIIVQDEASSVVWGMPGFVAEAGLADKILSIDDIGPEIVRATSAFPAPHSGQRLQENPF